MFCSVLFLFFYFFVFSYIQHLSKIALEFVTEVQDNALFWLFIWHLFILYYLVNKNYSYALGREATNGENVLHVSFFFCKFDIHLELMNR